MLGVLANLAVQRERSRLNGERTRRRPRLLRLSPLVFEHINLFGRYAFSIPEAITRDELRPLRNPAEVFEEVAQNLLKPAFCSVAPQHPKSNTFFLPYL
jgi:hypothetical protein